MEMAGVTLPVITAGVVLEQLIFLTMVVNPVPIQMKFRLPRNAPE
jgi:hypothetical protein